MDSEKIINQVLEVLKNKKIENYADLNKIIKRIYEESDKLKVITKKKNEDDNNTILKLQSKISDLINKKDNQMVDLRLKLNNDYSIELFVKNIFYAKNSKSESVKIENLKSNITTHPYKFTNPTIEANLINLFYSKKQIKKDGYFYSGNINESDAFDCSGNASTIPKLVEIYEFLNIRINNNSAIIDLINDDNDFIIRTLENIKKNHQDFKINYKDFKEKLRDFYYSNSSLKSTHSLIKQVYFPTKESYHLLSILSPSILMNELNLRIKSTNKISYELRSNEKDYAKFSNLFVIGFNDGDFYKMLNISNINKNNAGKFYLLPSLPPILEKRDVRLPKTDFFHQSLNKYRFKSHFEQLEKFIQDKRNNKKIRDSITDIIGSITDDVINVIYKIRDFKIGWSEEENYKNLSKNQKILLDNFHQEDRYSNDSWLDDFIEDLARWILKCYNKFYPDTAKNFGDDELAGFERRININLPYEVKKSLNQDKEYFR